LTSERLTEAAFLLETHWTHAEYEAAPDALVEDMMRLLNARAEASQTEEG